VQFIHLAGMQAEKSRPTLKEEFTLDSRYLNRKVLFDVYHTPLANDRNSPILLINDGQDMEQMNFQAILASLYEEHIIQPITCIAIHAGTERKMEYGVAGIPDFKGRGGHALEYSSFVLTELLPLLKSLLTIEALPKMGFAGFSLGGLSALDIAWSHPEQFNVAAVFSGSLWWRSVDQSEPSYNEDMHRIMHQRIRKSASHPGQRFFFQCGNMDESRDRNRNGVIDSIDDTQDLIKELKAKGYADSDICYLELPEGKHDVATWGKAMPLFLRWAFGRNY
jgi:enterochelin esterase-like enzyme